MQLLPRGIAVFRLLTSHSFLHHGIYSLQHSVARYLSCLFSLVLLAGPPLLLSSLLLPLLSLLARQGVPQGAIVIGTNALLRQQALQCS